MRGIDVLDIALSISQCGPIEKKKDFLSEGFFVPWQLVLLIPLNKPANRY